MVVCQYFLEGRCRFGRNCKNEHTYGGGGRPSTFDSQQLRNIMREIVGEITLVEKGGQWPLSCFAPIKEGLNIPGFEDYSPEEIRWKMYEARSKGTLDHCINEVKHLYNEAEKRRNAMKQPTMENLNLINDIIKMKEQSSRSNPFVSSSSAINQGSSFFGSSTTQTTPSQNIFGNSGTTQSFGNVFGGTQQNLGSSGSIFGGSPPNYGNQNIFGGAGPMSGNQNVFTTSQTSNQNLFTSSSMNMSVPSQNVFTNPNFGNPGGGTIFSSQATTSAPIFAAQSMLYQPPNSSNQSNVFGGGTAASGVPLNSNQSGIFNSQTPVKDNTGFTFDTPKSSHFGNQFQSVFATNAVVDYSVYSKASDLTTEEVQAFAAPTFTFGKIPLKPPPLESCK